MCVRKPGRNPKDLINIHVMVKLSELITGQSPLTKYKELGNHTVIFYSDEVLIQNKLIEIGAAINVMTKEVFTTLGLHGLRQTPRILELIDVSRVKPEWVL